MTKMTKISNQIPLYTCPKYKTGVRTFGVKVEAPIIDNLRILANVQRLYMEINTFLLCNFIKYHLWNHCTWMWTC